MEELAQLTQIRGVRLERVARETALELEVGEEVERQVRVVSRGAPDRSIVARNIIDRGGLGLTSRWHPSKLRGRGARDLRMQARVQAAASSPSSA